MKKTIFVTIVMFLITNTCFSQYYIYHGSQKFEATPTFVFSCEKCNWFESQKEGLDVTLAKNGDKGGYLMLAINSPFEERFNGVVALILEDGTFIKCIDRGIRDYLDKQTISLYTLTNDEIEKLKISNIQTIRFSFKDIHGVSPYNGSYTADAEFPKSFSEKSEIQYKTSEEIKALFGN